MDFSVQVLFVRTYFLSQQASAIRNCPALFNMDAISSWLPTLPHFVCCPRTSYFWESYLTTIVLFRCFQHA